MTANIRVTIWHEYRHEKIHPQVAEIYPKGMHEAIAEGLRPAGDLDVRTTTMDEPEHGLTKELLANTDVLIWWGHMAHSEVRDDIIERVYHRVVHEGMGLVVLHSGHFSKIFKKLMGTGCNLKWREANERERIWVVEPNHPIAAGLEQYFELPEEEMYGERFDIPAPDEVIFLSWFQGGEVFRSGCSFTRGYGRIFYFRPGHETHPTYFNPNVRRVILNAVRWAAPVAGFTRPNYGNYQPLEKLD